MFQMLTRIFYLLMFFQSVEGFTCNLNGAKKHLNPDGSLGGLVSRDARVAASSYIDMNAKICDRSRIGEHSKILEQCDH